MRDMRSFARTAGGATRDDSYVGRLSRLECASSVATSGGAAQ